MKLPARLLAALLCFAILTIWVEDRWAWGLFEVGVFLLAAGQVLRRPRLAFSAQLAALAFAAAWPFFQLAAGASVSRAETWNEALNWCTFFLVFALSRELFSEGQVRWWFLSAAVVFGTALALAATLQKYSSGGRIFWLFPTPYETDVMGPFVNRNQFAAWIELLLPVALYLALAERRTRALSGCAAVALVGSIVASASRAGFVLACGEIAAVWIAVAVWKMVPRKTLGLMAAQFLLLAVPAAAVFGWQGMASRWQTLRPDAVRVDALKASWQMARDRPWTGSGLGTWAILYPNYEGFDAGVFLNQAHNDWAQWAAEGGLPFVVALGIFAFPLCKPAFRSIYGLGAVAFLLHALVDYPMQQRPALAAWFFAIAGATMASSSRRDLNV